MKRIVFALILVFLLSVQGSALAQVSVGDIIEFGHYEQDNDTGNGPEAIAWLVLSAEDGQAVLISRDSLDVIPYNSEWIDVTWAESEVRAWLNGEFYNAAFDDSEKTMILPTTVHTPDNPENKTVGGTDTTDCVYLLSLEEAERWFAEDAFRISHPSARAAAGGAYEENGGAWWWLRDPGGSQSQASQISGSGHIGTLGNFVDDTHTTVRPVIRMKIETAGAEPTPTATPVPTRTPSPTKTPIPTKTPTPAGGSSDLSGFENFIQNSGILAGATATPTAGFGVSGFESFISDPVVTRTPTATPVPTQSSPGGDTFFRKSTPQSPTATPSGSGASAPGKLFIP